MRRAAIAVLACLLTAASAAAQRGVVVVLSSDMRPYQAASGAFRQAFGEVPVLYPGEDGVDLPSGTKVVVAFGGNAAVQPYPSGVTLVYGVAPGLAVRPATHDGPNIDIQMLPEPGLLLERLKALQPGLRRLGVLWTGEDFKPVVEAARQAGRAAGIEVVSARVGEAQGLPDALRSLRGKVDALWLLPDPALVTQGNFGIIRDFSYGGDLPFYAPTAGLVEQGAVVSVAPTFEQIGRAAADVVKKVQAGADVPDEVYLRDVETTVNLEAARRTGLTIPASALGSAKVLP